MGGAGSCQLRARLAGGLDRAKIRPARLEEGLSPVGRPAGVEHRKHGSLQRAAQRLYAARRLSDKFVAEQALAESYCANQSLAYAEIDEPVGEAGQAAPQLAPIGDAADIVPAVPILEETAADIAPAVPSSEETAGIAPAVPTADEVAEAAPPRAPADDEPINWVAWLTGAEKYTRVALSKGAQKDFKQPFASKKWLVQHLVVDRKVVRPDQVCPELAQFLPAVAEAAPTVAASAEAAK